MGLAGIFLPSCVASYLLENNIFNLERLVQRPKPWTKPSFKPLQTTQLYMKQVVANVCANQLNAVLSGCFLITTVGSRQRLL